MASVNVCRNSVMLTLVLATGLLSMLFFVNVTDKFTNAGVRGEFCIKYINRSCGEQMKRTTTGELLLILSRHVLELTDTKDSMSASDEWLTKTINDQIQATQELFKLAAGDARETPTEEIFDNKQPREVCPETFLEKSEDQHWSSFQTGFRTAKCSNFVPMGNLVTVFVTLSRNLTREVAEATLLNTARGVAKYYPKLRVIFPTKDPVSTQTKSSVEKLDIRFENEIFAGGSEAEMWASIMKAVRTPYVLVARQLTDFDDDVNLERLVRVLGSYRNVVIAGGSYRNSRAEWDMGCQQATFTNWTASYTSGYYHSFNGCVVCDFMPGPWVAKTQVLKDLDFK